MACTVTVRAMNCMYGVHSMFVYVLGVCLHMNLTRYVPRISIGSVQSKQTRESPQGEDHGYR